MKKFYRGIYLGRYIYAKELTNGEWTLYEGRWSSSAPNGTTGLEVVRDNGKPIRFASLGWTREYAAFRWGVPK